MAEPRENPIADRPNGAPTTAPTTPSASLPRDEDIVYLLDEPDAHKISSKATSGSLEELFVAYTGGKSLRMNDSYDTIFHGKYPRVAWHYTVVENAYGSVYRIGPVRGASV